MLEKSVYCLLLGESAVCDVTKGTDGPTSLVTTLFFKARGTSSKTSVQQETKKAFPQLSRHASFSLYIFCRQQRSALVFPPFLKFLPCPRM